LSYGAFDADEASFVGVRHRQTYTPSTYFIPGTLIEVPGQMMRTGRVDLLDDDDDSDWPLIDHNPAAHAHLSQDDVITNPLLLPQNPQHSPQDRRRRGRDRQGAVADWLPRATVAPSPWLLHHQAPAVLDANGGRDGGLAGVVEAETGAPGEEVVVGREHGGEARRWDNGEEGWV
jgi:hypothetical protein